MKTKIALIILLNLGFFSFSNAQFTTSLSLGYNQSFASFDSLNFIVDRYNGTRSYLDETMGYVENPAGFAGQFGVLLENGLYFEAGYTATKRKRYAEGVDISGTRQRRDLRIRNNQFNLGIGYRLLTTRYVSITPGATGNVGTLSFATRVYPAKGDKEKWGVAFREFNPSVTGFLQFQIGNGNETGVRLLLTPYYCYSFSEFNIAPVNEAINPGTALQDPATIRLVPNYFGLKAQVCFSGGR